MSNDMNNLINNCKKVQYTVSYPKNLQRKESQTMSDAGKLASANAIQQAREHGVKISYLKSGKIVIEDADNNSQDSHKG